MSAAPQLTPARKPQTYVPAVPATPAPAPALRPARRRVSIPAVLGLIAVWMAMMALAFSLVQTKAAIRRAEAATAEAQRQISLLTEQNLALEAQIANAASVEEVERWALAHGMKQPEGAVETLQGREEAVRTPAEPEAAAPEVAAEGVVSSFWQAWIDRIAARVQALAAGQQ